MNSKTSKSNFTSTAPNGVQETKRLLDLGDIFPRALEVLPLFGTAVGFLRYLPLVALGLEPIQETEKNDVPGQKETRNLTLRQVIAIKRFKGYENALRDSKHYLKRQILRLS